MSYLDATDNRNVINAIKLACCPEKNLIHLDSAFVRGSANRQHLAARRLERVRGTYQIPTALVDALARLSRAEHDFCVNRRDAGTINVIGTKLTFWAWGR